MKPRTITNIKNQEGSSCMSDRLQRSTNETTRHCKSGKVTGIGMKGMQNFKFD